MTGVWGALLPLVVGSAVVPIQVVVVLLLLQGGGRVPALAWVAGVSTVRLLQGLVFGVVLGPETPTTSAPGPDEASPFTASLLLVLGVLLLVMAGRKALDQPDEDAPPPRWLEATTSMGPGRAYLFGALSMVVGAKFWVFTLGAVAAIHDAALPTATGVLTFVLFVVLAQALQVAALVVAFAAPRRADDLLGPAAGWLTQHNRPLVIVVGVVFGVWFAVKGLTGLGLV